MGKYLVAATALFVAGCAGPMERPGAWIAGVAAGVALVVSASSDDDNDSATKTCTQTVTPIGSGSGSGSITTRTC